MKRIFSLYVALLPSLAFAQSNDKIRSAIAGKAMPWAAGIAVAFGGIGLVRASIKYSNGDADAKEHAKGAIIGSVIALSAGTLVGLLGTWFG